MQSQNSLSSLQAIRQRVLHNQQLLVDIVKQVASGNSDQTLYSHLDSVFQNFRFLLPLADRSPHLAQVLREERELLTDTQLTERVESIEEETERPEGLKKHSQRNYWTEEEDIKFQVELVKFWPDWMKIARSFPSRSVAQLRSHLQKFKVAIAKREGLPSDPNLAFEQFIATKREQLKSRVLS